MEQPGGHSVESSHLTLDPDAFISGTVSVVLACIESGTVKEAQVPEFLKGVHSTLIDIARSSSAIAPLLHEAAMGFETDLPEESLEEAREPQLEDILREVGLSVVSAGEVEHEAAVDYQPAPTEEVALVPSTPEAAAADAAVVATEAEQETFHFVAEPAPEFVRKKRGRPRKTDSETTGKAVKAPSRKAAAPKKTARTKAVAPQKEAKAPKLPRSLKSIDEALRMNAIVCLEDGKRVKDLSQHLATLGMSEEEYRVKWGLPAEYPMQAPSVILTRGPTYEVDFATGLLRQVRA